MKYRALGRTGLVVSEVGFSTLGIGHTEWIGVDKRKSAQTLIAAYDNGINFFDTAWMHGRGESERLLGRIFGSSSKVVIASKVPPRNSVWPADPGIRFREVFPPSHVFEHLRKTMSNIRRDVVDLYQFHVWNQEWVQDPDWSELIYRLRRSGRVRAIGISMNDHQPENSLAALESGLIDTVQVIYNIFDQSPEERLLPYCATHGIGVIARSPFDEGGLIGDIRADSAFPEGDFRNRYFEGEIKGEVWERVQRIAADTGMAIEQLPNLALRFCLGQCAVSTVVPGMLKADHVRMNVVASEQGRLPKDIMCRLHGHAWRRNHYPPPEIRRAVSKLKNRENGQPRDRLDVVRSH